MTWKAHYIADSVGRVRKISDLSLKETGMAIGQIYKEFHCRHRQLNYLHERLWILRKEDDPHILRTNTDLKIAEQFKLKETQETIKAISEENIRLKTIISFCLKNLDSLPVVEAMLKNAFGEIKDD